MLKSSIFAAAVIFTLGGLTSVVQAQRNSDGPVVVYDQQDGRGTSQAFDVGEFRNDRSNFGSLRNDSAASVYVADNFRIRLCESEARNGSGRCEEFGSGYHNLRYAGTASYIRITGPSGGWNGGNNNGGSVGGSGVTVYDDRDFRGASQTFGPGRFLNSRGQLGSIRNDQASSVVVERGYTVRFCDSEGNGNGTGRCEEYSEGRHNIQLNDAASYIEVRRGGGGWGGNNGGWGNNNGNNGNNGGWGNNNGNGNGNGGWNGGNNNNDSRGVIVYSERDQRGDEQAYGAGTFRNDRRSLGSVGNDNASSVYVPRGYRVRICDSEGGGTGTGSCEEYGPGSYNLRYNDKMSFIRVWRGGF